MEKELLKINPKDGIHVLGLKIDAQVKDISVLVNGIDITETIELEEIKILQVKNNAVEKPA